MIKLLILNDIVKPLKDGTQKVMAKNIVSSIWINDKAITCIAEIIRDKNYIYKNRCIVTVENLGEFVVKSKPYLLMESLQSKNKIVGYAKNK